jgi:hypothetical protein
MDEINITNGNTHKETARRPLVLTLLCLFSFVFFGLVLVLFLLALFWSGTVADMVFRYAPEYSLTRFGVYLYIFCGLILHAVSFTGIIFIWKMKRLGYLLLGPSSLVIAAYQLFETQISSLTTAFYIALIIVFGLFLKKLR